MMKTHHHPTTPVRTLGMAALSVLLLASPASPLRAQDQGSTSSTQAPSDRPPRPHGFHILPPQAGEKLNLSEDQKKQIADLENEVKAKIENILTPDQLTQLKQMRPPHPGKPGGQQGGSCGAGQQNSSPTSPADQ